MGLKALQVGMSQTNPRREQIGKNDESKENLGGCLLQNIRGISMRRLHK